MRLYTDVFRVALLLACLLPVVAEAGEPGLRWLPARSVDDWMLSLGTRHEATPDAQVTASDDATALGASRLTDADTGSPALSWLDREVISLRTGQAPGATPAAPVRPEALQPSRVSGFVNLRAHKELLGGATSDSLDDRRRMRLELDGALNVDGWVVEARSAFHEHRATPWQLGDVRVVRDLPAHHSRLELGDLQLATTGFQRGLAMRGLGVTTRFDLDPTRSFTPGGRHEFTLDRAAKVEVSVNGNVTRTLDLPAGRYDLREFQLAHGINDVRVRVREADGKVRVVDFGLAFEPTLLLPGTHQFSYAIGVPRRVLDGNVRFPKDQPLVSMFHRAGLSDALTAGVNLQSDADRTLLGAEATWATTAGTLRADVAYTRSRIHPDDLAARLRYDYLDVSASNRRHRLLSFAVEGRGRDFATVDSRPSPHAAAVTLSAKLEQDLTSPQLRGGVEVAYSAGRGSRSDSTSVAMCLKRRLERHLPGAVDLELKVERRWSSAGQRELRSLVHLTWTAASANQALYLARDSSRRSTQLDWTRTPADATRGLTAHVGLRRDAQQERLGSDLLYRGERFEAGVQHASTYVDGVQAPWRRQSSAHVGTALAFAGGRLALSHPISGSFAIVERSDTRLPLAHRVVRELPQYVSSPVSTPELRRRNAGLLHPPPPPPRRKVYSTYKSGTLLTADVDPR